MTGTSPVVVTRYLEPATFEVEPGFVNPKRIGKLVVL
jgi:hypothetical protein